MVNRPLPPVQEGPAFLGADYSPEDLSFSLEGPVKGGTLRALVAKLTTHQGSASAVSDHSSSFQRKPDHLSSCRRLNIHPNLLDDVSDIHKLCRSF